MKKVMFVVVMLLAASTCFAQLQSGPSNTVGYVKIVCAGNPAPGIQTLATPFGLPFKFWDVGVGGVPIYGTPSTNPSDICGDQLNCGLSATADQILRQDDGTSAYRNTSASCAWAGTLETGAGMGPGRAYFYKNRTDANRNFVLAGEVDNTSTYLSVLIPAGNAYTPYAWRDSRSRSVANLQLLASGFTGSNIQATSDKIVAQVGGGIAWRNTVTNTWAGTLPTVEPGSAYFINNRHVAYTYNYDPSSNAGLSVPLNPSSKDNGGSAAKMITSPSKSKVVVKNNARQ